MGSNLTKVMPHVDASKVVSPVFKYSGKCGVYIGRAVLNTGTTAIKAVTRSGVKVMTTVVIPEIKSKAHRDGVVKDLLKMGFNQETTASMMNISQSTVSRIHRK